MTWDKVKFFYQHSLSGLTASEQSTGYEVANFLSPFVSTLWKANTTKPQTIEVGSAGSPYIGADYFGLGDGHNFRSAGAGALLMFSDDGFVNSVGFAAAPWWPASDGPFAAEFAQSSHRAWRLSICGSARGETFYEFTNSNDGWTGAGLGITQQGSYVTLTSSSGDPIFQNSVSLHGSENFLLRVRLKRASADWVWGGELYYGTTGANSHYDSASYRKVAPAPTDPTTWSIVEWDTRSLTAGGLDWVKSTITRIRFDFVSRSGDIVDVDYVEIGTRTNSVVFAAWGRWGAKTELDWTSPSRNPVGRERKDVANVGLRGDLQGVWPRFVELQPELEFSFVDSSLFSRMRDWEDSTAGRNFLYAWETSQHSYDLYVVRQEGGMEVSQEPDGITRRVKIKLRGKT